MNALTSSSPATGSAVATNLREFLAFKLGAEEYGIDILRVQEIRSYEEPTRIANAPPFMKGVVNLRGVIVPIIDMRMKFNLEQANYDDFTVVIVLNIGSRVVGMVVDAVSDVITLQPAQLRHDDRHVGLGHGIHRRRQDRNVQRDIARDPRPRIGLTGQHV
jgi:purine-binding chemotaxis protein CheW